MEYIKQGKSKIFCYISLTDTNVFYATSLIKHQEDNVVAMGEYWADDEGSKVAPRYEDWKKDKMNAIKTKRLTIRHIVADDWKSIKDIWVDFNTSALSQYDKPHNTDDADVQPRIAKWAAANSGTKHMFFAICFCDTVIGYIAFNIRENGHEIGYCFHSAYHGKGYAKEGHLALIDYIRELGIKRLTAGTALNNTPSVALLKSLGFQLIETEKVSFYKDIDGNDVVFDGGVFELIL